MHRDEVICEKYSNLPVHNFFTEGKASLNKIPTQKFKSSIEN